MKKRVNRNRVYVSVQRSIEIRKFAHTPIKFGGGHRHDHGHAPSIALAAVAVVSLTYINRIDPINLIGAFKALETTDTDGGSSFVESGKGLLSGRLMGKGKTRTVPV